MTSWVLPSSDDRPWRDCPPQSRRRISRVVQNVNALIMQKRTDRKPGEWKEKANQAGSTYFVVPELVVGSLREGFERIRALPIRSPRPS